MSNWKVTVNGSLHDFEDYYGFCVDTMAGAGHSPVQNRTLSYAMRDGSQLTSQKMGERIFTLSGTITAEPTLAAFHAKRQALINALSSRVGKVDEPPVPLLIRYTGATETKEIKCYYDGGLELSSFSPIVGSVAELNVMLRFIAVDPAWYAIVDTVESLDTRETITLSRVAMDDGLSMSNLSGGVNSGIALEVGGIDTDGAGNVYVCGNFEQAGGSAASCVAMFDGTNWNNMNGGVLAPSFFYPYVNSLKVAPNGDVFIVGRFQSAGGVAVSNVAKWDGTTYNSLNGGSNGWLHSVDIDNNGNVYVGGLFSSIGGVAANNVAMWNGTTWTALGSGLDDYVAVIKVTKNNDVYLGGNFLNAGSLSMLKIARWDGVKFSAVADGFNYTVRAIAIAENNDVYIGGVFTKSGSTYINKIAVFNGSFMAGLDGGCDNDVESIDVLSDGSIIVGGKFTHVGTAKLPVPHNALWSNGWTRLSAKFNDYVLVVHQNGDRIYYGGRFNGITNYRARNELQYLGTELAYPVFTISRSGGTYAIVRSIKNDETGAELRMSYDLQDGETLTIDLRPDSRAVTSSYYGAVWRALQNNSDFTSWYLQQENNAGISAFVDSDATIETDMTYRKAFRSID